MRTLAIAVCALTMWSSSLPASGAWSDSVTLAPPSAPAVPSHTISTGALSGVSLTCAEATVAAVINAAKVSWTPSTSPATLSYSARILQSGQAVPVDLNSSATVTPSLLSAGLFGTTVTLRVTGTLPGAGWTVTNDRSLSIGTFGTSVDC